MSGIPTPARVGSADSLTPLPGWVTVGKSLLEVWLAAALLGGAADVSGAAEDVAGALDSGGALDAASDGALGAAVDRVGNPFPPLLLLLLLPCARMVGAMANSSPTRLTEGRMLKVVVKESRTERSWYSEMRSTGVGIKGCPRNRDRRLAARGDEGKDDWSRQDGIVE